MGFQELLDGRRSNIPLVDTSKKPADLETFEDSSLNRITPGVISLRVPGVLPELRGKGDRVITEDNLSEMGSEIFNAIKQEKKVRLFGRLKQAIKSGDKKALVTVTSAGIITVTVAAVGMELGLRGGKDFDTVRRMLHKLKT